MAKIIAVVGKNGARKRKDWLEIVSGSDPETGRLNVAALTDWIERERITEIRFALATNKSKGKGTIFVRAVPIRPVVDADELTKTVQSLEGM